MATTNTTDTHALGSKKNSEVLGLLGAAPTQSGDSDPFFVTKTHDATGTLAPGETFNYLIDITNNQTTAAEPFRVIDKLPDYVTLVNAPTASAGQITNTGTDIHLNLLVEIELPPGATIQIVVPVSLAITAPEGIVGFSTLVLVPAANQAQITGSESTPPVVASPGLTVKKTNDTKGRIAPGGTFNYVISITNQNAAATNNPVVVDDDLPPYVTLAGTPVSSDGSAVENAGSDTTLNLIVATSIPAQAAITLTVPVRVATEAPSGLLVPNTVVVNPGGGIHVETETEKQPPRVEAQPHKPLPPTDLPALKAAIVASDPIVFSGDSFYYALHLTNVSCTKTTIPLSVTVALPPHVCLTGRPASCSGEIVNLGTARRLLLRANFAILAGTSTDVILPVTLCSHAPIGTLKASVAVIDLDKKKKQIAAKEKHPPCVKRLTSKCCSCPLC